MPSRRALAGGLALAALGAVLWALYGGGYAEYDASYSLLWGRDLASLDVPPDLEANLSPTPHPLPILVGALVAPLGEGAALDAVRVLGTLSLAGVGVAAYLLGARLFSRPVGVLFAVLLVTRPLLVRQALVAQVDVPFLALVLAAAAVEARRSRAGAPVLALLAVAGLLRPEAWLLSAAYLAWALWRPARGRPARAGARAPRPAAPAPRRATASRARLVALAAAAPLAWTAFDLATTGNPLHSLEWTGHGADRLDRPQGLGTAFAEGPGYLSQVLRPVPLAGAALGLAFALLRLRRRAALPIAIAALGGLAYLAIGAAGLALLPRYLVVPGAMLALLCAVGALGWLRAGGALRVPWALAGLALAVALALAAPGDADRLAALSDRGERRAAEDGELRRLAPALARACEPLAVTNYRLHPLLAYLVERRPGELRLGPARAARAGTLVAFAGRPGPAGFARAATGETLTVWRRCA